MPETYPGFQNDGAFQLAEDAGFATGLVTVEAPPPSGIGGALRVPRRRGRRYRAACALLLVVDDATVSAFSTTLQRDDEDVLALLVVAAKGQRVALLTERDDEDVVLLVAAGARGRGGVSPESGETHDAAAWLQVVEEDEQP